LVEVHAAPSLDLGLDSGPKRGARSWAAIHRGPAERCLRQMRLATVYGCSS